MEIIDGKKISQDIKTEIAKEVSEMIDTGHEAPHLVAILVGDDGASQTYVKNKEKACKACGIISSVYRFPDNISEEELLQNVHFINEDKDVDGLIVQLPLPKHINEQKVIEAIDPKIDVDGFHPTNYGRMALNLPSYIPATPMGVIEMLKRTGIKTSGKNCVVIGRSHIVGAPMSILMSRNDKLGNATVTLCHSRTENLKEQCVQADIVIAAVGKPHFVTADMVKKGAVVIDVGIHRLPSKDTKSGFKLVGDVDYANVAEKTSYITPVPGGVGPMTIACLLINTLKSKKNEIYTR